MTNITYILSHFVSDPPPDFLHTVFQILERVYGYLLDVLLIGLILVVVVFAYLLWSVFKFPFRNLERDYELIRRDWQLLDALLKDIEKVSDLGKEIDAKPESQPLYGEELNLGKTVRLQKPEKEWRKKTADIVEKARGVVHGVESRRKRKAASTFTLKERRLLSQYKSDIEACIDTGLISGIHVTLSKLRLKIASLRGKPIDVEQEHVCFVRKCFEKTDQLVDKLKRLFPNEQNLGGELQEVTLLFSLFRAFLLDLACFGLASETEKAWVEEAEKLVDETQVAVANAEKKKWRLFSSRRGTETTRSELVKELKRMKSGFSDLFQTKKSHGFKFTRLIIRGDPSFRSLPRQASQNGTSDEKDIKSIAKDLKALDESENLKIGVKLGDKFVEVWNEVDAAKQREGINSSTGERLEQMKKLKAKAKASVDRYKKSSANPSIFNWNIRKKFEKELTGIKDALDLLQASIDAYAIPLEEGTSPVVALEEDTRALFSHLTSGNGHDFVVFIVGMEGVGKTTLAEKIFKHTDVAKRFRDSRYWVSLRGEAADYPEQVTTGVLASHGSPETHNGEESWINRVHNFLKQRTYLVVLDNMVTENGWTTLKSAFPKTNGSRIMVITRDWNVAANRVDGRKIHVVPLRTKEESWRLFKSRVHFVPELPEDLEKLAKEKVEKCGGLPLAIMRLGYLMSRIDVTDPKLRDNLKTVNPKQSPWSENLKSAMEVREREENFKNFFLLFLRFPEYYEIPARRLVAIWVANQKDNHTQTPESESATEKYLQTLVNRNLIQVVKRNIAGEVKKCCLPYALLQVCRQNPNVVSSLKDVNHTDSSLRVPCTEIGSYFFHSFYTREGNKPGEEIGAALRKVIGMKKFQTLRVLDLEHVFRPHLPKSIENLKELRYLGLRWTYLESIPSSIGNLVNLQTLDINHTYIREVPGSVWELKELRHLYLDQNYRSRIVRPPGTNYLNKFRLLVQQPSSSSPKNLQILWGIFIDKNSFLTNQLSKLKNLTKLGVTFQLTMEKQIELAGCVVNLEKLKSLRLRSIDKNGKTSDLWVQQDPLMGQEQHSKQPFKNLKNLSSLYLCGRLRSDIPEFPQTLSDLTLSATELTANAMRTLGILPNLKSLGFYSGSYSGRNMDSRKGEFPHLLVLKLWKLNHLEEMLVEEGAMENLRELEIRSCSNLQVPKELNHLKSLKELKIAEMPKDFAERINKKWPIWPELANSPMITTKNQ